MKTVIYKRKRWSVALVVLLVFSLSLMSGCSKQTTDNNSISVESTQLNMVAGTSGGVWYIGMGAIGKLYSDNYPGTTVNLLAGGSSGNPLRLESGETDFSITQHTMAVAAAKGQEPYKKATQNVSSIINLKDITRLNIVVRDDVPIYSIEDILEKKYPLKLAHGPVGTVSEVFGRWAFEEYGVGFKDITSWGGKLFANNYNDVASLFQDGQIDMFFWTGPGEAGFIQETASGTKLRWLPVKEEVINTLAEKYGLNKGTIPAQFYGGAVGTETPCVIDATELIVRKDLQEEIVYNLTKVICENKDDIVLAYSAWNTFDPETAWQDLGLPLHPGAEKYYKEKGWIK
ncbi:TRAP transporter solute receptor, TAXI family [Desulfitobacterium dichloroeliminans LMG P-21439]|uniref:TRAP transporter solute receptor, TAXI family n=1 Tax=Desulfitobacterium dichloroeliminans (strain LMG P-21439 / DCA1) TaxID=871963 RepID=L0F8K9_DESDL|nr:TAXI family TRAP transporter solute-binding subunit [Desulfitobacterium dichloroeliminans]AGA69293.1 TRAP transporter solute receptor, TAXI family [Desulfitobacterium dichloroeliminans LMG P-21439]